MVTVVSVAACAALGACTPRATSGETVAIPESAVSQTPPPPSVAVEIRNVAYAGPSPSQTLDLYLPANVRGAPLVVLIHGGGFLFGSSQADEPAARLLVQSGFAVAAVNYRLSGEALFPAAARDVKAAVRWLRSHGTRLGIDTGRIGVWGSSAGGWLANMLGATGDRRTLFDDPSLGDVGISAEVQAVVSWFGLSDFGTLVAQQTAGPGCGAGTIEFADPDSYTSLWLGRATDRSPLLPLTDIGGLLREADDPPPWLVVHGDRDCVVPPAQSTELVGALAAAGARTTHVIVLGAGHGGDEFLGDPLATTVAFLDAALRPVTEPPARRQGYTSRSTGSGAAW